MRGMIKGIRVLGIALLVCITWSSTAFAELVPLGNEFRINTTTAGDQDKPDVAMDAGGNFVVVWESPKEIVSCDAPDIYMQRYFANGTPNGGEVKVNSYTAGPQAKPKVAMDNSGNFVVVWE